MPLFIGNGDENFSRSTEQARLKAAKPQGFRSALTLTPANIIPYSRFKVNYNSFYVPNSGLWSIDEEFFLFIFLRAK